MANSHVEAAEGCCGTASQTSEPIVQASLNVIGVSDVVSAAIGQPLDNVRALQQEAILWKAVEEEARNFVAGLAGANLLRRQKLADLGAQAYAIGSQVAKVPENEVLVSHVEEIKRLKRIARRRKPATPAPQQPSPAPSTTTPGAPSTGASQVESKCNVIGWEGSGRVMSAPAHFPPISRKERERREDQN